MKKTIIIPRIGLQILTHSNEVCGVGSFRVITKCQAGFMVTSTIENVTAYQAFRRYQAKAIQAIACILEHGDVTVYARTGKKVWIAEAMLAEFTVGDINQDLSNTALYSQMQYQAVNASTWASKAYVMNE